MIDKIGREILKTLRIYRKPLIDRDIEGDRIVIEFEASLGVTPPRPPYRVIQRGMCDAAPGFATSASLPVGRSHTGFGHVQPTVSGQRDR